MTEKDFKSKMKRLAMGLIAVAAIGVTINSFTIVDPGYVGVVVNPFGDEKGVETEELHVGCYFIAPWKTVYRFPVFEQNDTWEGEREGFHFQTAEGMAVHADIGITYHLRPSSIPEIFQKYRRGMYEISQVFIRNYIRDAINKAASRTHIEELYSGKASFFEDVERHVKADLNPLGIELSRIYLIGRFHFPQTVIHALNAKIEANQRAEQRENELREAEAEAKKKIAEAEGQARCRMLEASSQGSANLIISQSLTPELIQWQAIQKWDGQLPSVTGGSIPLIQLPN